jgi:hypothetical protein
MIRNESGEEAAYYLDRFKAFFLAWGQIVPDANGLIMNELLRGG